MGKILLQFCCYSTPLQQFSKHFRFIALHKPSLISEQIFLITNIGKERRKIQLCFICIFGSETARDCVGNNNVKFEKAVALFIYNMNY